MFAHGNTLNEHELIWIQLSKIWFLSLRASDTTLLCTHSVRNGVTIVANDKTLTSLPFIGAKHSVISNWAVVPYIELRVSCATEDICVPTPSCPDKRGVVRICLDSYESIWLTGFPYTDYWLLTYPMAWPWLLIHLCQGRVMEMWLIGELFRKVNEIRKSKWWCVIRGWVSILWWLSDPVWS